MEGKEIKLQLRTLKKGIQDIEICFPTAATAASSPQKNNNESNNKILYQKKTRKKSWIMWRQDHRERG